MCPQAWLLVLEHTQSEMTEDGPCREENHMEKCQVHPETPEGQVAYLFSLILTISAHSPTEDRCNLVPWSASLSGH